MTILRRLWASPATLIGLMLSPFFDRRGARDGVLLCEGARWPRRLGWHYSAITFGHVVLAVAPVDAKTWAHERVHVAQYERWGPFFIPAYVLASLVALVGGRHPYRDNPFERAARGRSER